MNIEKIPENGKRINRDLLSVMVHDIIESGYFYNDQRQEHECVFCGCFWMHNMTHTGTCSYLIAEHFVKEYNL